MSNVYPAADEFPYAEPEQAYFDWRETFPQLRGISDARVQVLDEVRAVGEVRNWFEWPQEELWKKPGQLWDVLPLVGFGRKMHGNLSIFPELAERVLKIPGLRTAIFSRVGPGTTIEPHRGPFALSSHILRCHFGISAPVRSGIWVRGEFRQQQPGEWLVFDDLCLHSGLNEHASEPKIVLLLDLKRPASARPSSWPAGPFPTQMPEGWEPVLDRISGVEEYDPESL